MQLLYLKSLVIKYSKKLNMGQYNPFFIPNMDKSRRLLGRKHITYKDQKSNMKEWSTEPWELKDKG